MLDVARSDRAMGPQMKSEGWHALGGDGLMWLHPPSNRSVVVDGP
jgi:hypothetical protein